MRYLLLLLLLFSPLAAAEAPEAGITNPSVRERRLIEEVDDETNPADFGSELAHLALSLGAILVILLILSWIVRRLLNTRIEQANVTSSIKVLEKRYLNPKAVIYVVAIGNKNIIVGESPQGLVNLGEIRGEMTEFEKAMNRPIPN